MIPINRTRTETAILPKYRGKKRVKYNLELLQQRQEILNGTRVSFEFKKIWGDAKTQLMLEAHYKCAYCEKKIDTTGENQRESSFSDVEHYRPSSTYWWLAYCYENYLFACEICNRSYKNDKFPILNSPQIEPKLTRITPLTQLNELASRITPDSLNQKKGKRWSYFHDSHISERPFILNPYYDANILGNFFGYEADDILREVRMFVLPHIANASRYENAINDDLGLNRISLRQDRYDIYEQYRLDKDYLALPNIPVELRNRTNQMIQRMQQANYPYSGMIRYFENL